MDDKQLPAPVLPKPGKKTRPVSMAGRSARRPAEDTPSLRYLSVLKRLGPRPNESKLAYEKRLAAVAAGRQLIYRVWREQQADKARVALALGIPRASLAYELRMVGLDADMLDSTFRGVELPE